ncbi:MAG: hypothetical protein CJBNEKGG_02714 [Prosthecobacter sp.]|nr:hypothetical protein [Prosthecobacter sp.]
MNAPRLFIDSATLLPRGLPRLLYRPIRPLVERACCFKAMNDLYARLQGPGMTAPRFCEEALQSLDARVEWPDDATLAPLCEWQGPLVLMANHPFGGVEALALMRLMERLRPGKWRLLANSLLASVPELIPHLIALDPLGQARAVNHRGLAEARCWLDSGGLLGVFPAGRVAAWHAEHAQVLDLPWSDQFARLAASAHAAVALLHVPGANSGLFLRVPLRWPRLRSLFLPREMMRRSKPAARFHIGPLMEPALVSQLTRPGHAGAKLRARCHLLAEIQPVPAATPTSKPPVIAPAGAPSVMQAEVEHLNAGESHLFTQGRFTALLWQRHEAPQLFHELSRLREITFRASGQGGGSNVDITREDDYYHQLVLWDKEQQRLVGAYRLGITQEVLAQRGQHALYLDYVFHIQPAFLDQIGPAIELTRSFIHPDYQKDPLALSHLWRGLGQVCARRGIRSLFGSVTIPASVSDASRAIIVEHLRRHHLEDEALRSLIQARSPFQPPGIAHHLIADAHADDPIESLRDTIRAPDGTPRSIPPLIRHYLSMNARFLDFHVEREFGNALYCLLRVDLHKAPAAHLRRFLGTASKRVLLE